MDAVIWMCIVCLVLLVMVLILCVKYTIEAYKGVAYRYILGMLINNHPEIEDEIIEHRDHIHKNFNTFVELKNKEVPWK